MKRLKTTKEIINTEVTYHVDYYCCKEMKRALTLLKHLKCAYGYATFEWRDQKIVVDLYRPPTYSSSGDDIDDTIVDVKFCPFCGEKIE